MSARKLRVGTIELGWYAAGEHVPSLRATGRAEVVASSSGATITPDIHPLGIGRFHCGQVMLSPRPINA
jgi:hypothetical protein